MCIPNVADVTAGVVQGFLGATAAVMLFGLLNGRINTRGLLYGRTNSGAQYFSPERVQLLATTLFVALNYFTTAIQTHSLPDVSPATLGVLGGSHAVYLGGKAIARLSLLNGG